MTVIDHTKRHDAERHHHATRRSHIMKTNRTPRLRGADRTADLERLKRQAADCKRAGRKTPPVRAPRRHRSHPLRLLIGMVIDV